MDISGEDAPIVEEVDESAERTLSAPFPDRSEATTHVIDESPLQVDFVESKSTGDDIVIVDAINHALREEMKRNEKN